MVINYCCFSHFNMAPIFHTLESELFLWMLWINIIWQKCCYVTCEYLSAVSTIVFWKVPSMNSTTAVRGSNYVQRPQERESRHSIWCPQLGSQLKQAPVDIHINDYLMHFSTVKFQKTTTPPIWSKELPDWVESAQIILRQKAAIVWSH